MKPGGSVGGGNCDCNSRSVAAPELAKLELLESLSRTQRLRSLSLSLSLALAWRATRGKNANARVRHKKAKAATENEKKKKKKKRSKFSESCRLAIARPLPTAFGRGARCASAAN